MALFDTATGKRIKELRLQDGGKIARLYRTSDNALLFNSGGGTPAVVSTLVSGQNYTVSLPTSTEENGV